MSEQRFLVMDYETRSKANLKLVGGFEYSLHPSTEILCISWRVGTRAELKAQLKNKVPSQVWSPMAWSPVVSGYGEFIRALVDPTVIKVAHNVFFERVITANVLSRIINKPRLKDISISEWMCTASLARAVAIPGKLELAVQALKLPFLKDMAGHRTMLKLSKPRAPRKKEDVKATYWHEKPEDLKKVISYCQDDVTAETALLLLLPPLSPNERRVWELDQKINMRGFFTDRKLVGTVLKLVKEQIQLLDKETITLTRGQIESTTQRDEVLRWCAAHGVTLEDLRANTVTEVLKSRKDLPAPVKRILQIRQAVSKTSTAKYVSFWFRSKHDGRVRDNLVYHQATTGRFAGAGVQPQNFPRGTIKNAILAAEIILETADLELVRLLYGDPMAVFASVLRPVIKAPKGRKFYCGDQAGIEVRVLFWVAGHEAGLKAYREGRDLYKEMASHIFNKPETDIDSGQRQVGKEVILGCGFGMGKDKFYDTLDDKGIPITTELAEDSVKAYRDLHSPIPKLWRNLERAAIAAVQNPGKKYSINKTKWWVEGRWLWCELPSGRKLAYYGPKVKYTPNKWTKQPEPKLYHWTLDSKTRKWVFRGTWGGVLTENVVQAIARDTMVEAMLRVEDASYEVVLHAHDELLAEREESRGLPPPQEFASLMAVSAPWAIGLPVKVEAWTGERYRK